MEKKPVSTYLKNLEWRYATKKFDPQKKVSDAELQELLEVLRLAPSSYGLQPWKFIVITDKALRQKLREHAWNQHQITDASHLIVLCARKDVDGQYIQEYVKHIADVRNIASGSLEEFKKILVHFRSQLTPQATEEWTKKQVYIALGFLLSACAQKRIDACPMEGFDKQKFDEVLGLEKGEYTSTVLCPIGYRSPEDNLASLKKVRFPQDAVIGFR